MTIRAWGAYLASTASLPGGADAHHWCLLRFLGCRRSVEDPCAQQTGPDGARLVRRCGRNWAAG